MTHCDIPSRRSRLLARNPLLDRYSPQGRSQQLANHGDVVIEVIRHVELRAFSIRIQHADLYHGFLLLITLITGHTRWNARTQRLHERHWVSVHWWRQDGQRPPASNVVRS